MILLITLYVLFVLTVTGFLVWRVRTSKTMKQMKADADFLDLLERYGDAYRDAMVALSNAFRRFGNVSIDDAIENIREAVKRVYL